MEQQPLSLHELNGLVKRSIRSCLPDTYWVQAELSDVRTNYSGHCYLEFVQKDAGGNNLIAKARGTIWSNIFKMLKPYFEQETGQSFTSGIKVLVEVSVEFHELYGYSLTVLDIDPTYTVGDMERKRREILRQLEEEGVIDLNKELEMPMLPQRIAVISSATAAGYGDFCDQLQHNRFGFKFHTQLYPAIMQGDTAARSIVQALNAIAAQEEEWDVVVIIRGGGATTDLQCFDDYVLASHCAQFPLPIVAGIGHTRDVSVVDMVVHTSVKTPTAAAEWLIERVAEQVERVNGLLLRLQRATQAAVMKEKNRLLLFQQRMHSATQRLLSQERSKLAIWQKTIELHSPERIFKMGYSLTTVNGKVVRNQADIKEGDVLTTYLEDGVVESVVK